MDKNFNDFGFVNDFLNYLVSVWVFSFYNNNTIQSKKLGYSIRKSKISKF